MAEHGEVLAVTQVSLIVSIVPGFLHDCAETEACDTKWLEIAVSRELAAM
jgi:hypothetical protein